MDNTNHWRQRFKRPGMLLKRSIPPGRTHAGAEYFAANPKHKLRVWFRTDGVELVGRRPTKEGTKSWDLSLRLHAWGRKGALKNIGRRQVHG